MNASRRLLLLLLLPWCCGLAHAADLAIIVHPSVAATALDVDEVRRLWLGKTDALPDGTRVRPLGIEESPLRDEFLTRVLRKNEMQFRSHWARMIFTGNGQPPRNVGDPAEVLRIVATQPGYIGYVPVEDVTPDVKVLLLLED
jgi:hypothetical protein